MDLKPKLQKAKIRLLQSQPFFATLVMSMLFQEDPRVQTAQTNGKVILYSPDYFDELTVEEIAGVLAHEVLHITLLHHCRTAGRDLGRWNQACDYAINPVLIKAGLELPEGARIDPAFEDHTAEHIYTLLPVPPEEDEPAPGIGDVTPPPAEQSSKEHELWVKNTVRSALLAAKLRGKLPAGLDRLVQAALEPKIDWQTALAQYLSEVAQDDYSWTKPNKRYLGSGLILPGLESIRFGPLILMVDTSSSIDEDLINQFAGEAQDITRTFSIPLLVLYVDAELQSLQEIDPDEPITLHPKGGGGTSFQPGFDYIEKHDLQPKAVVYLTDGDCDDFPDPPDYPVLWAQYSSLDFQPPFGEVSRVS